MYPIRNSVCGWLSYPNPVSGTCYLLRKYILLGIAITTTGEANNYLSLDQMAESNNPLLEIAIKTL